MIGTEVNGYRFLEALGRGGMGEVYLAEHVALGRVEAVKILRRELAEDRELVRRFRREARAINRVQHPCIVSMHDSGQLPDGRCYLSMEYVEGVRLDREIVVAPLAVPRAVSVLTQLADAVAHAHERGVVHRDLKPSNLILARAGGALHLKILDFGIAKIIAPEYDETDVISGKGHFYGTPAYIAPELWHGAPPSPALDVYAIGCIGFELVVGRPPFTGPRMEVLDAHLRRPPPPPSAHAPHLVPATFDDIVLGCLAKEPAARFADGSALRDALAAAGLESVATAGPAEAVLDDLPNPLEVQDTERQ